MQLEIVSLWDHDTVDKIIRIEPAGVKRQWMDDTSNEYAYRCLPLNIANQHGWAVYPQNRIVAMWDGKLGTSKDHVIIVENPNNVASSWFGEGTLTFHLPFLVRLDPGYSLFITGAPNHFMKGIQACSGVYEADWAPYSFTMNWKFTHSYEPVVFTPNDPICFFYPVPRELIDQTTTKYSHIDDQDDHFKEMAHMFGKSRDTFLQENTDGDWQKNYFKGLYPDGSKCPFNHKTKLKPKQIK